ncbi:MAG TPA: DUF4139 domain-containing protein, partial [Flavobacteriales bacterium]|nr:DUF4139 domain-containing protein [Flavobacteriales bacterium]
MKTKILIPIFALLMQVTVTAQSKESETESKISAVTVFFSGAQINRKATVNLQPGTNIIRFSRLSYYIDPNSIQVEGSNKFTIVSVNHRHNFLNDADELPEVKPLKAKIDKLTEELELLKIDMNANQEEREMILANKQFIGANKSVTVDDMMDMSELYQNKYAKLLKDHAEFQKKEKELKKDLKRHRDQMKVVTAGKNLYTSDIIVNLSSPAKTETELSFKYVTSNAGWTSAYDAKAIDVKNPLSLTYKAKVVQTTGEDWKNIKLTLSTGNPTRNNNRPTLATWQLSGYDQEEAERRRKAEENRYQNKEASKKREKTAEAGAPSMAGAEVDMLEEEETVSKDKSKSTASLTTVQQDAVSLEFSIAIPYTIASDGKDYTVEIARHELNASYRYYASPKYDNSAFLVSYISGWEKFNLMSGMASVYFG